MGWQVSTPTPDDLIYEALAGDDANPAVPGYDPDLSAELYTTNGETTEHAHDRYGTLALHAGDVHLRDRQRGRPERRLRPRGLRERASTSRTPRR